MQTRLLGRFRFSSLAASTAQSFRGKPVYDVVISGCGPVGAGLACALSSSQLFAKANSTSQSNILILDSQPAPTPESVDRSETPDQRVYSISGSSQRFMRSVGVWDKLNARRLGITERMQVWESTGQGYLKFNLPGQSTSTYNNNNNNNNNSQSAATNLGILIENNNIVAAMVARLRELDQVEFAVPDSIESFGNSNSSQQQQEDNQSNLQQITLKSGREIYARIVVGSDGRYSAVKEKKGIPTYGWMYNQMGLVCTIKTSCAARNTAYQRYLEGGPLAILPLWDDYSSIVWSVPFHVYEDLMKLDENAFMNQLNQALSSSSKTETPTFAFSNEALRSDFTAPPVVTAICNKRMAFPLAQLQSKRYIDKNVALIGDAAHSIHPHAGQGVNMGLNDAVTLANILIKNKRVGHHLGELMSLQEYETQAKMFNYANAMAMEFIKKTYELPPGPLAFLRNFGANLVNNSEFLKDNFMKVASQHPLAPSIYEWNTQFQ